MAEKQKILIVDDDSSIAELVPYIWKGVLRYPKSVKTGEESLEKAWKKSRWH